MGTFFQDLKYGARGLLNRPGFALIVVITLGLGIGANTAIFSVLNAVLYNPLPYENPDELVLVWDRIEATGFVKASVPAPDVLDFRERVPSLIDVAAMNNSPTASITGEGAPEEIVLSGVTANFFALLGVEAQLGRGFLPEDGIPFPPEAFNDPVNFPTSSIILSHGLWKRRYASDPDVIGKAIRVDGRPFEIVGVMPEDFRLHMPVDAGMSTDIDAWNTLQFDFSLSPRDNAFLRVVARKAPDASLRQVRSELSGVAKWQRSQFDYHRDGNIFVDAYPMHSDVVGHVRPVLLTLLGAVGFVLLIACGNVANLLLVRASSREREIGVRVALGGGRVRIVRQMLTESLLIAAAGGLVGLLLAGWGIDLLTALKPDNLPRLAEIGINRNALIFTAFASVLAALLFGLVPALQASSPDLTGALKERTVSSASVARRRVRDVLVVTEVGLSMVLLFGAGLLLKSFATLQETELGFNPKNVQTFTLSLPFVQYPQPDQRSDFFSTLEGRIEEIPGVEAVASVFPLPLGGRFWTGPYKTIESTVDAGTTEADYRAITPDYFSVMGTRLIAGRVFDDADNANNLPVVVVDQFFADRVFGGEEVVGKSIEVNHLFSGVDFWVEIIGVVENVRHEDVIGSRRETIYFSHRFQEGFPGMTVAVRTAGLQPGLLESIRQEVAGLNTDVPVSSVRTMDDYVEQALAPTKFSLILVMVFAAVALAMASIGLYGVISSSVKQRTGELGIRLAFGAPRSTIIRSVVGNGLALSVVGVVLGVVASLALGSVFATLVVGVAPFDLATLAAVGLLLIVVSVVASYVPARRAVKVDPVDALRND